ncbi:MAG: hypothetical protein HYY44_04440 [Deltaproteobacteria bacterium]|nr:hypothetical protein [Deltaproteobacteria bacterium]MBI4373549.1 hypothetical protein [Deltaproteobacteria bacterium]
MSAYVDVPLIDEAFVRAALSRQREEAVELSVRRLDAAIGTMSFSPVPPVWRGGSGELLYKRMIEGGGLTQGYEKLLSGIQGHYGAIREALRQALEVGVARRCLSDLHAERIQAGERMVLGIGKAANLALGGTRGAREAMAALLGRRYETIADEANALKAVSEQWSCAFARHRELMGQIDGLVARSSEAVRKVTAEMDLIPPPRSGALAAAFFAAVAVTVMVGGFLTYNSPTHNG